MPNGGAFTSPIPSDFNGFVYMLEGEASLGANQRRASRAQIAVLGPGQRAHRGRCAARNTFHAHGREAIRRDADLQRTICRLMAVHGRHGWWRRHRRARTSKVPGQRRQENLGEGDRWQRASDRYLRDAERLGMRRVSRIRWLVVPPSSLRRLRPHRLLRLVAIPARQPPRGRRRSSGGPELRARRGLVLGLRERALHGGPGVGSAPPSPARPTRAGTNGSCAPRLGTAVALTCSTRATQHSIPCQGMRPGRVRSKR